ncbi:MAG TPA: PQQ-binding-like beta-propeller repeat protein [Bryobacterales bacterium]|jgi:alcohol dehydrogenase (cytochrome c)|nr:PQQ-binding-like beta-propeller repeat protein [Bryobacterales bacterium]
MKTKLLLVCLLWAAACTAAAQVTSEDLLKPNPNNWLTYSGSYNAQRHTLLNQINTSNVANLQAKWIYHMSGAVDFEAVPIVVNGVMYISQFNRVDALDGRTGRLIWQYQRQPPTRGWQRGVAVYGHRVYVTTADSCVIALDARTGALVWETKAPGGVRLQGGAPLIVKGKVYVGGSGRTGGFVQAYDAETGKHLWTWNVIPKPGEPGSETWEGDSWKLGGGPTWLTGSYDPDLNLLYWGTGQPGVDFVGEIRKGDNLYTDCMVALDPDTGKLKWYFQFTPHDVHDWDAVEIPVLVDAEFKGQMRKLLIQANRNGYYYILDRTNGKFLFGTPFVNAVTWSSGLTEDGRPVVVPGTDPTVQGNKVCPSTAGATNWPSPAYNPDTHYFYLIAQEGCGINYKASDNFRPGGAGFNSGTGYMESPDQQERWQLFVRALDLTTGKKVWDYEEIGSHHYGPGLLSTAGGVLFAGEQQGQFTALDARTGKVLWHFNTGDLITASPMAYSIDGKEYVAIGSGTNVIAFGLPDGK